MFIFHSKKEMIPMKRNKAMHPNDKNINIAATIKRIVFYMKDSKKKCRSSRYAFA